MTKILPFNSNWYFVKKPIPATLQDMIGEDIGFTPVTLPHDWLIYDTKNLYQSMEGWYYKAFDLTDLVPDTRYVLRFEGVYMNSFYYVNGHLAGTWKYGYSTFELDITPYICQGKNELYVQVVYKSPNSRWYSGAGIYRRVWLKFYPSTHIAPDGIYIHTNQSDNNWKVELDTEICIPADKIPNHPLTLQHYILDAANNLVGESTGLISSSSLRTAPSPYEDKSYPLLSHSTSLTVSSPALWDITEPNLYQLKTVLFAGAMVLDEVIQSFGFRTYKFDSSKGFFLNGRPVKIHGACEHHDLGCLGAATHKEAIKRKFVILKEMGVNAVRTSHNMPAVEFMELADEMGLLIVSEAFDMWERPKTNYDYAQFFPDWWKKDVACWVRRDRNHPSILMWGIGNEIYDTHASKRGQLLTKELQAAVLAQDPKQNAWVTIGSNYMPWEHAQKCADILKLAGYNYGEKYYSLHHEEHPDWIIYGSETSSTVQSRGIYHFPLEQPLLSDDDEQCSALGNSSTSWGAKSTEACIIADRDAAYSPGQFIWSGFDYIGEPTPYHTKNSYFGQIDTAGFPKDSYYIYQAEWTDYKVTPMVHLFPYWDFSEGQLIDVRVCSNALSVELLFNNISIGSYDIDHIHGEKLVCNWKLPYKEGVLKAIAYDENNIPVAWDETSSFKDASALVIKADKQSLSADGFDLVFLEISAKDENGIAVENANNRIFFDIEGPGRLIGLDNGDSTDFEQYKCANRRLFSGKLLAVIAGTNTPGCITVQAVSKGLKPATIKLTSFSTINEPAEKGYQYACYPIVYKALKEGECLTLKKESILTNVLPVNYENADEIPIRKLEIICPQGNTLTKEIPALFVKVKIHPENATYSDVEWRVTNAAGIDSNLAVLTSEGTQATLSAIGDGTVYVRCAARNGSDKIRLISQMEFTISSFGEAFITPYDLVSAGVYTFGTDNLTNGNERGMATARDDESIIGFEGIDFGDYGSDTITLPIFALDSEEFPIEIWEGIPGREAANLLTVVTYQKPSKWNEYQEETYYLPKRLKGISAISFVLHRKIHLKGFSFTKYNKALQRLTILDYNKIYGDTFTLEDTAITNIGNNVSIVFEDLDFGDKEITELSICGHSPLDNNTLHLIFSSEQGDKRQIVEFSYSEDYVLRKFALEPVTGKQTITFVFLPGCQFDFQWFQFQ